MLWTCVGQALAQSVRRFRLKIQSTSNGKKRKQLKGETWIKASLQPHEIEQSPNDVVAHLTRENRELNASLEAKAADLYRHMCDTHSGKDFTEVGKRQRQRHDTNTVSWLFFYIEDLLDHGKNRQAETLCQITFYYTITSNRVYLNRRFPRTRK